MVANAEVGWAFTTATSTKYRRKIALRPIGVRDPIKPNRLSRFSFCSSKERWRAVAQRWADQLRYDGDEVNLQRGVCGLLRNVRSCARGLFARASYDALRRPRRSSNETIMIEIWSQSLNAVLPATETIKFALCSDVHCHWTSSCRRPRRYYVWDVVWYSSMSSLFNHFIQKKIGQPANLTCIRELIIDDD